MHNASERFAKFLTAIIQLVLLISLFGSTATYFIGHPITASDLGLTSAIDLGVAVSFESATWLFQRLVRGLWQLLSTMDDTAEDYERTKTQFKLYIGITAGLMLMSCFYYGSFLVAVHRGPIDAATWFAIGLRAVTTPALLFVLSFTSKLAHDASDLLANASHTMLVSTTKATIKQWKQRIKRARRNKIDLAPIAMSLMEQEGHHSAAQRIRIIAEGLDNAEGVRALPNAEFRQGVVVPANVTLAGAAVAQRTSEQTSQTDRGSQGIGDNDPAVLARLSQVQPIPEGRIHAARNDPQTRAWMADTLGLPERPTSPISARLWDTQVDEAIAKAHTSRSSASVAAKRSGSSATKVVTEKTTMKRGPKPQDRRTPEQKEAECRRIIEEAGGVDNITIYALSKQAKVSESTASKWYHKVERGE